MKEKRRIGFFVDDASLPNISQQLQLLTTELSQEITLDLFYQSGLNSDLKSRFNCYQVDLIGGTLRKSNPVSHNFSRIASFALKGHDYIGKHQPDALIAFTNPPILGTAVGLATRSTAASSIYRYSGDTFHEYEYMNGMLKGLGFFHYNSLGRWALSLCDRHIVLGDNGKNELTKRNVRPSNIYTIPPTVDKNTFYPSDSDIERVTTGDIGLFVGRIDKRKGANRLQKIVEKSIDIRPDLEYIIIGDGPYKERFATLPDRIRTIGQISHSNIPKFYRASSFLIHPSHIEGLPNVVLEAKACNTPVITSPVGEMPEYADIVCNTVEQFTDVIINSKYLNTESDESRLPSPEFVSNKYSQLMYDL